MSVDEVAKAKSARDFHPATGPRGMIGYQMFITDDFVMINFPKTASTFARSVIASVYGQAGKKFIDLSLPVIVDMALKGEMSQHGTIAQIPAEHRNKQIVSIVRNPFDRYISLYTFKWWQKHPPAPIDKIKAKFPSFPEISFSEYLLMTMEFARPNILGAYGYYGTIEAGINTLQFIAYYSLDPLEALNSLAANGNVYSSIEPYIANVTYLSQQNLRIDIYNYLANLGFKAEQLLFIMTEPEQNVSRVDSVKNWKAFYDDDLYDKVASLEHPILERFHFTK